LTDSESLHLHRLKQSEETLADAERMLEGGFSPRSTINRAYYSMFYALMALFLKSGIPIKTSKHIGVIATFDKEFVKAGKIDKHYSKIIHDAFDARQESDYKDFVDASPEDASEFVGLAGKFLEEIKKIL
jgi:uncharacterized protein (UPF0332 family)